MFSFGAHCRLNRNRVLVSFLFKEEMKGMIGDDILDLMCVLLSKRAFFLRNNDGFIFELSNYWCPIF